MDQQEIGIEFLKALNRYFTPVAVGVMLCGLILNPGMPSWRFGSIVLLIIGSLTFNMATAVYVMEHPASWKTIGYSRVVFNTAVNAGCYILLHKIWPMIWVLFALGPIAMALYGDNSETFGVLGATGLVMGGVLLYDGGMEPRAWGEAAVQLFFILLVSLFLIRMAALIRRERAPAERKA